MASAVVRDLLAATSPNEALESATIDDIVEMTTEAGDVVLEASGVRTDGAGSLAWALVDDSVPVAVRKKYRMMCAMLKDSARNRCYANSIERAVRAQISQRGDCLVLDIGTGFGFLGLVAARAGATVVAVEMNSAVARSARLLVEHAGLEGRMSVHTVRSDEVAVESEVLSTRRADVIVTETLDSDMLREGIVPTLRHACAELLAEPHGVVVPACAEVYVELVAVDARAAPCLDQLSTSGLLRWGPIDDGATLHAPVVDRAAYADPANAAPIAVQADHLRRVGALTALCDPVLARSINFHNLVRQLWSRSSDLWLPLLPYLALPPFYTLLAHRTSTD